jgi:outer membrane protein assembly factor BamB
MAISTAKRLIIALTFIAQPFLHDGLSYTSARQNQPALSKPLHVKWAFEAENISNITPVVNDGAVFVPLNNGTIVSLQKESGALSWKSDLGGFITSSPTADSRGVYLASEISPSVGSKYPQATGVLRALGSQSGVTLWMRTLPSPVIGAIASNATTLFGRSSDGRIYAVKKENGEIGWIKYGSPPFNSSPILYGEKLYALDAGGYLYAIEVATGRTLWRYRTRARSAASLALIEGMVYAGSDDGYVHAIEEATGRMKWRARTGAAVQAVQAAGRCVLATSLDNFVYCLSKQRGGKVWKRQLPGRVAARPLVLEDEVLLSPLTGDECVVLSLQDGRKLNSVYVGEDNNSEADPLLSGDLLLITTRKGVLAFSNQTPEPDASGRSRSGVKGAAPHPSAARRGLKSATTLDRRPYRTYDAMIARRT